MSMRWRDYVFPSIAAVIAAAGVVTTSSGNSLYLLDLVDPSNELTEESITWAKTRDIAPWVSSVVAVEVSDEGWERSASGVVLDTVYVKSQKRWHTYILTAGHVVLRYDHASPEDRAAWEKCAMSRVRNATLPWEAPSACRFMKEVSVLDQKAELLKWESWWFVDLALLKIVTPDYPRLWLHERQVDVQAAILSTRTPKTTEEVWTVGFPGGIRMITQGYVGANGFSHSAASMPGSTGGGVFRDGRLIGINVIRASTGKFGASVPVWAMNVQDIQEFLDDAYGDLATTDSMTAWVAGLWK